MGANWWPQIWLQVLYPINIICRRRIRGQRPDPGRLKVLAFAACLELIHLSMGVGTYVLVTAPFPSVPPESPPQPHPSWLPSPPSVPEAPSLHHPSVSSTLPQSRYRRPHPQSQHQPAFPAAPQFSRSIISHLLPRYCRNWWQGQYQLQPVLHSLDRRRHCCWWRLLKSWLRDGKVRGRAELRQPSRHRIEGHRLQMRISVWGGGYWGERGRSLVIKEGAGKLLVGREGGSIFAHNQFIS